MAALELRDQTARFGDILGLVVWRRRVVGGQAPSTGVALGLTRTGVALGLTRTARLRLNRSSEPSSLEAPPLLPWAPSPEELSRA